MAGIGENSSFGALRNDEISEALALVWDVFQEFEGPDYPPQGMQSFRHDIIDSNEYREGLKNGTIPMYVARHRGQIVSVIAFRPSRDHLSLAFTKKEFQRRGYGAKLFAFALDDLRKKNPDLQELTVHSSPYGLGFYQHLGFKAVSGRKEENGIIYIPMKIILEKKAYSSESAN